MTLKFHAIARLGSYSDKATGKKVNRYATCGTVFESPNGRLFMRLDTLPVSPDWSGFISFREVSRSAAPDETPDEDATTTDHDEAGPF